MKTIYLGIDVSANTLDICVKEEEFSHFVIENKAKSIKTFLKPFEKKGSLVIAMENTGIYNYELYSVLEKQQHRAYVICPIHMSKSFGLTRGKSDKVDAQRICQFIIKNQDELAEWKPTPDKIKELKILVTERDFLMKEKRSLLTRKAYYKRLVKLDHSKKLSKLNDKRLKALDQQVIEIEALIKDLVKADQELKEQQALITSIPGVGEVLAWTMLVKTEGFTRFSNPRKFACYSGVAPFGRASGTSYHRRPRVSSYADKSVKSLLHMSAMSAIRYNKDLKKYYERKILEGKNKMATLNAVRNKLIHRMFAVIKNQKPYQNDLVLS